jgi:hypothetical protein
MEITSGKREDVAKAVRKLKQMENNFVCKILKYALFEN